MSYVPIVAFKVYQMSVHVGVFKLLVAQNVLDEFDVFSSVVFHRCFSVPECAHVNLSQFGVLEGSG